MEPFKNLLNADVVRTAARHLQRAWPGFDAARFTQLASEGLEGLEFKARAQHLCAALEATLPADFEHAADVLEASLAPVLAGAGVLAGEAAVEGAGGAAVNLGALRCSEAGLAGWVVWPMGEFVARRGLATPARALRTLHALTQRFSAEFALRPFIVAHPDLVFATLAQWARDPSAHVRRLVSEGSRPRLPWGLRLQALVADPTPTLPLLLALQDDPSDYVRRSVANHLNDVAKDHPQVLVDWIETHLPGAPPPRRALLRHASRSLIKQGHARTLALWGLGEPFRGEVQFSLGTARAVVGEVLVLSLTLVPAAAPGGVSPPQVLEIDYRVHHVKAGGGSAPKVFKGWRLTLTPTELAEGASRTLRKRHSLRPVTTRRYHPGLHRVEVQINGQVVAEAAFELVVPPHGR